MKKKSSSFSSSSSCPMAPEMRDAIEQNNFERLFFAMGKARVQPLDFAQAPPKHDPDYYSYKIMVSRDPPQDKAVRAHVQLLFPNHPNGDFVLNPADYSTHRALNQALNERFTQSQPMTPLYQTRRLCVAYGQHVYDCQNMVGNFYLLWAEYIQHTNLSNVASRHGSYHPILVHTDGYFQILAIYYLRPRIARPMTDLQFLPMDLDAKPSPLQFLYDMKVPPFVCDRPRPQPPLQIRTMSKAEAVSLVVGLPEEVVQHFVARLQQPYGSLPATRDAEEHSYDGEMVHDPSVQMVPAGDGMLLASLPQDPFEELSEEEEK